MEKLTVINTKIWNFVGKQEHILPTVDIINKYQCLVYAADASQC